MTGVRIPPYTLVRFARERGGCARVTASVHSPIDIPLRRLPCSVTIAFKSAALTRIPSPLNNSPRESGPSCAFRIASTV